MNDLIKRCENMMNELGIPLTAFCKKIELSPSAYYKLRHGDLKVSQETAQRIETFLGKYNF